MADNRKITVEIPQKSYNLIRQRSNSPDCKTSRVLSRYLFIFMMILTEGEHTLFRKFSQKQARELAIVLNHIHCADGMCWEEMATLDGERLGALVGIFDTSRVVPVSTVSALKAWEILALMEYAQIGDPALFEAQTARFRGVE